MRIPGTHMHIVPFIFACLEIVILFYLMIYKFARPGNRKTYLDMMLVFLLFLYNVVTGLLPDRRIPGSLSLQISLAYATGFVAPCFFPYYVLKCFDLQQMKLHAYKLVWIFIMTPYFLFVFVLFNTGDLGKAKNTLLVPFLYGLFLTYSLFKSIQFKYHGRIHSHESTEELVILFLGFIPWVILPLNDYFHGGPVIAAIITNLGFLLLLSLHIYRHIKVFRIEHLRLEASEKNLHLYNRVLQLKIDRITEQLTEIHEQGNSVLAGLSDRLKEPLFNLLENLDQYIIVSDTPEEYIKFKNSVVQLFSDMEELSRANEYPQKYSENAERVITDLSLILKESVQLLNVTFQTAIPRVQTDNAGTTDEKQFALFNLTQRQIEIVRLIQKAYTNKQIGLQLFISERTVSKHIQNMFEKVGVSSKIELINKLKQ